MEHLDSPTNSKQIRLQVPFVAKAEYHGEFKTYTDRNNTIQALILKPADDMNADQAMIHLQTWLYFGVLRELTIDPSEDGTFEKLKLIFTQRREHEGSRSITTCSLSDFWNGIQAHLQDLSNYEQERYQWRLQSTIQSCSQLISQIDQDLLGSDHQAIVLSIFLLAEFVLQTANLREIESSWPYIRSHLIEDIMREDSWCPSDIERLRLDLDVGTLLYTAKFDAPPTLRGHHSCGRTVCEARQILPAHDYTPRHAAGQHCECRHLYADQEILLRSLEKSIVPVCQYFHEHQKPTLVILESTQVSRYVAISHVWSDMMGNRDANSLPGCLLKYIQKRVDALYEQTNEHVAFWIDTILCPVEPCSATEKAIALMRETYAHAEKVLVLDQYLEHLESRDMTDLEQSLRIICSGWTRRLWTLQEGVLAKKIYFQFRNSAIDGDALFMRLAEPPIAYRTIPIFHIWLEIRLSWNGVLNSSIVETAVVWMLYRALRFRTTSVDTDEALCLSTLTNVDLKAILEARPDDRMHMFWKLMPHISTALLYWDGPRLNTPGLRWAPRSLLRASPESFMATYADQITKSKEIFRVDQGIVFCSSGILLGQWKTSMRKGFWIRDERNLWYYVNLTQDIGLPKQSTGNSTAVGASVNQQDPSLPPKGFALLMDMPLEKAFDRQNDLAHLDTHPACLLVSISGTDGGLDCLFATFESAGVIRQINPDRESNALGFTMSALVEVVESELSVESGLTSSSAGDQEIRHLYENMKLDAHTNARIVDDPTIDAVIQDGRLNLVLSGEHVMFTGRSISSDQCFCIG